VTPARSLDVAVIDRSRRSPLNAPQVGRLLRRAGVILGAPPGEVAVLFTRDEEIRRLNRRFRARDEATDVLAFPDGRGPAAENRRIGDIVISVPAAGRQARAAGRTIEAEVRTLLIHGFLHLLGYDHEVDGGEMAALERDLARRLSGPPRPARRPGA
jgi:probable rRNA maturation factor